MIEIQDILVIVLAFISFIVFYYLHSIREQSHKISERVKRFHYAKTLSSKKLTLKERVRERIIYLQSLVSKIMKGSAKNVSDKYRLLFEQAGWTVPNAAALYIVFKGVAFIAFIILFVFLVLFFPVIQAQSGIVKFFVFLVFLYTGIRFFDFFLDFLIRHRYKLIKRDITSVIDLLIICATSGLSLERCFQEVAKEIGITNKELGKELALTSIELAVLPDRRLALKNLARRVNVQLVRDLSTTLIQAEEHGTAIAQTLKILSQEFTKQKLLEIETKAGRIPVYLALPLVLFILPSLFIVILGPSIIGALKNINF
jgi:tight adherence protein C